MTVDVKQEKYLIEGGYPLNLMVLIRKMKVRFFSISFLCLGHLYYLYLLITTFQAITFSYIFRFLNFQVTFIYFTYCLALSLNLLLFTCSRGSIRSQLCSLIFLPIKKYPLGPDVMSLFDESLSPQMEKRRHRLEWYGSNLVIFICTEWNRSDSSSQKGND